MNKQELIKELKDFKGHEEVFVLIEVGNKGENGYDYIERKIVSIDRNEGVQINISL